MTKQHFNFDEIFSFAWSKTKQHAWFLFLSFMIYSIIMSAVRLVPIVEPITGLLVALSMLSMSLIIVRNESFSFADLFAKIRSPKLVINFVVLSVAYAAVIALFVLPFVATISITAGTLLIGNAITTRLSVALLLTGLFIIPGIYIAVRFKFFPYVLLENEHMSLLDVVKHTYKLTCCATWHLLILFVAITVLNIVGTLLFLVGLFITIPISMFALAHAYRKLEGHSH